MLGDDRWMDDDLDVKDDSTYDPEEDSTVLNEFSTVAQRFGHTLIDGFFRPLDLTPANGERLEYLLINPLMPRVQNI